MILGGEFISFIIDKMPIKEQEHVDLEDELYRQFRGNELFHITQKDIDNWDSYLKKLLPNYVGEDIGRWLFHPMLRGVRVWVEKED